MHRLLSIRVMIVHCCLMARVCPRFDWDFNEPYCYVAGTTVTLTLCALLCGFLIRVHVGNR